MIQPSIDELLTKTDNKYALAVVSAMRARELVDGAPRLTDAPTNKSVSIALCEIGEGHVRYQLNDHEVDDVNTDDHIDAETL